MLGQAAYGSLLKLFIEFAETSTARLEPIESELCNRENSRSADSLCRFLLRKIPPPNAKSLRTGCLHGTASMP